MTKGGVLPATKRSISFRLLGGGLGSWCAHLVAASSTHLASISASSFQPSFFVVYNMVTTEVIAVFENTSDELLELFENFCDLFRNATLHSEAVQFPCSASSNNFARQIQRR